MEFKVLPPVPVEVPVLNVKLPPAISVDPIKAAPACVIIDPLLTIVPSTYISAIFVRFVGVTPFGLMFILLM